MKFIIALVVVLAAVASATEIWEGKKYKNYESENFEEYMKELGVGYWTRLAGNRVSPTVELKKLPDGKYQLLTKSTFKDSTIEFELGKEFDETTLDGRDVKSVITLDGNKLTHEMSGDPPSTIIREFGDKEMNATMTVKNVVCTRKYRVQE
ncbi:fatty acid-binding protein, muscle-like [Sitodiplosis mosellana]|uniref:fatty acid-binding protein, muscle-like n=1 Tax=Sitodiplosis mosellana TaxID=263140 RepID=UPI002443F687|nr:fatty acid-binding protein, muscle-like [Sitodiplosis mosellana]